MSSGRISDGKPIVNASNIQKETKAYRTLKANKSWSSFDCLCDYQTRMWQINFIEDKDTWFTITYNCNENQKNYICKHVILQVVRLKYVEIPTLSKTVPLHDMPKRGRPATISKPLQIDN